MRNATFMFHTGNYTYMYIGHIVYVTTLSMMNHVIVVGTSTPGVKGLHAWPGYRQNN